LFRLKLNDTPIKSIRLFVLVLRNCPSGEDEDEHEDEEEWLGGARERLAVRSAFGDC
jgi:hypothetical protein